MIYIVLVLFIFCVFFSIVKIERESDKKIVVWLFLLLLICVAGFRGFGVDRDYEQYVNAFYSSDATSIEISFVMIVFFIKKLFGENFIYLFLSFATLGVFFKYRGIKELSSSIFLSLMVYISHYYLLHEMTQIRAGVAAGFFLLCIKPIYDRNLKRFLLFAFLAVFFHYSAVLIFPLWYINARKSSSSYLYALVLLGILLNMLQINLIMELPIPYIQRKMEVYKEAQELGLFGLDKINVWNLFFIMKLGLFFLLLYKKEFLIQKNKYLHLLLKIEALSLFALPAFAFIPALAFRVYELYGIVEIIILPLLVYLFDKRIIGYLMAIFVAFLFLAINLFYNHLIY